MSDGEYGLLLDEIWMGDNRESIKIWLYGADNRALGLMHYVVTGEHGTMTCGELFAAVDGALNLKRYGQFDPPGVGDEWTAEEWARGDCPACHGTGRRDTVVAPVGEGREG